MNTRLPFTAGMLTLLLPGFGLADAPANNGPVKLVSCSWLGNASNDGLVGAAVGADGSLLLAGNSIEPVAPQVAKLSAGSTADAGQTKRDKNAPEPGASGFVARLAADGTKLLSVARFDGAFAKKLLVDDQGAIYLLAEAPGQVKVGPADGTGTFIARLSPEATKLTACTFVAGAIDFGLDANGEFVVLTKGKVTRYAADGQTEKWSAGFKSHGDNRAGGVAVSPTTGIAAVTGYGMTHTGKEPYKDPYAYGFDRGGQQVWRRWNPDPKLQQAAKFGGNGLMADTSGHFAAATAGGKLLLALFADGGNSVCTRDPEDPSAPLAAEVFDGVFQKSAGHGFKGASKTSVIFRVDPASGKLEKGTWMCAWLSPARANGLSIDAACGDAQGRILVAGNSAFGCPTKEPWYTAPEGGYQGGGFLAVFDAGFKLLQCGYFPGTTLKAVAQRNGTILLAGSAVAQNKGKHPTDANAPEITYPVPSFHPLQAKFGGGDKDGWFAVFKTD